MTTITLDEITRNAVLAALDERAARLTVEVAKHQAIANGCCLTEVGLEDAQRALVWNIAALHADEHGPPPDRRGRAGCGTGSHELPRLAGRWAGQRGRPDPRLRHRQHRGAARVQRRVPVSPIEFGALVPCRTCRGTGKSRNPDWGDKDASRQRERQRRRGQDVDKPTELVKCVECGGGGFMRPADADKPKVDRENLIARSVVPR